MSADRSDISRILLTGANGRMGRVIAPALRPLSERFRVVVRQAPRNLDSQDEVVLGDLSDAAVVASAVQNVDTIVHLAALPDEGPLETILASNIAATAMLYEQARQAGVRRIVFASTHHVVGFYPAGQILTAQDPPRPDTTYGVSKVFGEALARFHYDKWGMESVCLRIGSFRERPENSRQLSTWLSHRDGSDLVARSVLARDVGFTVLFGVSSNHRSWWDNGDAAAKIGFHPQDDAEAFAHEFNQPAPTHQGGPYIDPAYIGGLG